MSLVGKAGHKKRVNTYKSELFPVGTAKDKESAGQFATAMKREVEELVGRIGGSGSLTKDLWVGLGRDRESKLVCWSHRVLVPRASCSIETWL
jgi:hypothetical protein